MVAFGQYQLDLMVSAEPGGYRGPRIGAAARGASITPLRLRGRGAELAQERLSCDWYFFLTSNILSGQAKYTPPTPSSPYSLSAHAIAAPLLVYYYLYAIVNRLYRDPHLRSQLKDPVFQG